jgi:hypothetical protein
VRDAMWAMECEIRRLRCALAAEVCLRRAERLLRVLERETRYRPDQPRLPAGTSEGGRWTRDGEGGRVRVAINLPRGTISDGDAILPVQDRASGYPIDLRDDPAGQHIIEEHVAKSDGYLRRRLDAAIVRANERGEFGDGLVFGSFTSLDSATRLINSTVAQNQGEVEAVVSGRAPAATLRAWFDTPTGKEAYARTERSEPIMRETYGVAVPIIRDAGSERGYRLVSAFPINKGP